MTSLNAYALELSFEEMNVLQVAIDHMVQHQADLHTVDPSDKAVYRRLDAAHRLKKWFGQETRDDFK
jgi:hypothetical protein|tara:strand:- start:519 stop:719 length:201 start_codon:yes stop_codon:yes gene_type:complete